MLHPSRESTMKGDGSSNSGGGDDGGGGGNRAPSCVSKGDRSM